ncbi:hypothetical protein DIPPA_14911 [Diplonema papillatum]|nr:hypothetical protein DIPPA_14911 [Diplonema papillatum]
MEVDSPPSAASRPRFDGEAESDRAAHVRHPLGVLEMNGGQPASVVCYEAFGSQQNPAQRGGPSGSVVVGVTLADAVKKIRELKTELHRVRTEQQEKIESLQQQLVLLERAHLDDRKRLMDAARSREQLLLGETDPSTLRKEAEGKARSVYEEQLDSERLTHRAELRKREELIRKLVSRREQEVAELNLCRREADLHVQQARALQEALKGNLEQTQPSDAYISLAVGDLFLEMIAALRAECPEDTAAADDVLARVHHASAAARELEDAAIDPASILRERIPDLDLSRAAAKQAKGQAPAGGFHSPGPDGRSSYDSDSPGPKSKCRLSHRVADVASHASLQKGKQLLERAFLLQKAAEELRRSRSNESRQWSQSPRLPASAFSPSADHSRQAAAFAPPHVSRDAQRDRLRLPPTEPRDEAAGGEGGDPARMQSWVSYWQTWKKSRARSASQRGRRAAAGASAIRALGPTKDAPAADKPWVGLYGPEPPAPAAAAAAASKRRSHTAPTQRARKQLPRPSWV